MAEHDVTKEPTREATEEPSLNKTASSLARAVLHLDPGSASALRRGPLAGAGAAAFWKLAAEHAPGGATRNEAGWATLFQAIAILTPKGSEHQSEKHRRSAHDPAVPMGAALRDAEVSELRLARLLSAPNDVQRQLAVRLCRRLAGTDHGRFHLGTLASLILFGNEETERKIARDYYSRARANAIAERTSDGPNGQETSADA